MTTPPVLYLQNVALLPVTVAHLAMPWCQLYSHSAHQLGSHPLVVALATLIAPNRLNLRSSSLTSQAARIQRPSRQSQWSIMFESSQCSYVNSPLGLLLMQLPMREASQSNDIVVSQHSNSIRDFPYLTLCASLIFRIDVKRVGKASYVAGWVHCPIKHHLEGRLPNMLRVNRCLPSLLFAQIAPHQSSASSLLLHVSAAIRCPSQFRPIPHSATLMQADEGRELTSLVASNVQPPVAQCSSTLESLCPQNELLPPKLSRPPLGASRDPTASFAAKKCLTPVNGHQANPKQLIKLD